MVILRKAMGNTKHIEGRGAWYLCGATSLNGHPRRPVIVPISDWCLICSILRMGGNDLCAAKFVLLALSLEAVLHRLVRLGLWYL